MRVVTSGSAFLDIDAYAGCIAYAELLQAQGVEAVAASNAPLNESISSTVRTWSSAFRADYQPSDSDTFTLIDVSDPDFFDRLVDLARVDEVIDHHPGFEQYWQERIADKAHIEFIGAACTLVYERWNASKLLGKMSVTSARLLVCGILDNTLNFGAKVATVRDKEAYQALLAIADLPDDWTAQYFSECQEAILKDAVSALRNDTKVLSFKSYEQPISFGQLVVWDAKNVLADYANVLKDALVDIKPDWFLNLVSVGERKSYFYTDRKEVQDWLTGLLGVEFDDTIAVADRLWLRKEVLKQDIGSA